MLRIQCPWCGLRNESEFSYGGDASVTRPADEAPLDAWYDYVYTRDNPRGIHREHWHHVHGCRAWIVVERDTLNHEIHATAPASATMPYGADAAVAPAAEVCMAADEDTAAGGRHTGQIDTQVDP